MTEDEARMYKALLKEREAHKVTKYKLAMAGDAEPYRDALGNARQEKTRVRASLAVARKDLQAALQELAKQQTEGSP